MDKKEIIESHHNVILAPEGVVSLYLEGSFSDIDLLLVETDLFFNYIEQEFHLFGMRYRQNLFGDNLYKIKEIELFIIGHIELFNQLKIDTKYSKMTFEEFKECFKSAEIISKLFDIYTEYSDVLLKGDD